MADILMAGVCRRNGENSASVRVGDTWVDWDSEQDSLAPAQTDVFLNDSLEVFVFRGGALAQGECLGYIGYRLSDGTIVFNGIEPISVTVRD
ncbi:MAG: hypothetical protein GY862_05965 [Gammaproteobacteria bacterium]|nr:hypothetical protein [Gammaproteobacteria bacterium]